MVLGHFGLGLGAKKAAPAVSLGALFGLLYEIAAHSRAAAGVTLGLLVVSHWLLDFITHRPDLPLTLSATTRLGLGLWNSVAGTLAVAWSAQAMWLIVVWAYWVDRHRAARSHCQ